MNTSTKFSAGQKGFSPLFVLLGIILIIGIVSGAYYFGTLRNIQPQLQRSIPATIPSSPPSPILSPIPLSSLSSSPATTYNWVTITAAESANWKSYTKYGFTLKYPPDWREDNSFSSRDDLITILTSDSPCPSNAGCGGQESGIHIYLHDTKQKPTSKDYINGYVIPLAKLENSPSIPRIIDSQPSYFSDIDATVAEGFFTVGSPGPVAFIYKRMTNNWGNEIIELSSISTDNDIVSKIFSSFKFTQ